MFKKRKARYSKRKQMKDDLEKLMFEYNQRQLERQEYEELTQQKIQQEYEEQERIRLIVQEFPKLLLYQASKACDLFTESDKIFISFRFQYKDESYKSWIVFTGRTYDENNIQLSTKELLVQTPHIPLMGGCWSNHTAMRMLAGQQLVSYLLENAYWWLKYTTEYAIYDIRNIYVAETEKKNIEIIKVDRCLYAPVLYLMDQNHNRKYMSFLSENYPEAYKQVLKYSTMAEYWENYHDADVEAVFHAER